ncbi:MAG: metallophosphoesterase family protein, partial [Rubripirellula sp.]
MPIHFPSPGRREFLTIAGSGVVLNTSKGLESNNFQSPASGKKQRPHSVDDELVVILNDTHIGEKHPPDSPVPSNLRFIVNKLTHQTHRPACVIINGDLALKDGQPGDYQHFSSLIQPLRTAEIETHLTLGNHDNREVFYDVLKDERNAVPTLQSLHVSVVETRHANFFLLDSLKETMVTQGTVGRQQMNWLARTL